MGRTKMLKGRIRNKVHDAFVKFREDGDLRQLVRTVADVADISVRSYGNAVIMYEQIDAETESEEKNENI